MSEQVDQTGVPMNRIPGEWAERARCPLCGNQVHLLTGRDRPDKLGCLNCWTTFEVEENGPRIRILRLPNSFRERGEAVHNRWLRLKEIKDWRQRDAAEQAALKVLQARPSDEQVLGRALTLAELGNSRQIIESSLLDSGATKDQVERALSRMAEALRHARNRNRMRVAWALGIILVLIVFIALIVISLTNGF